MTKAITYLTLCTFLLTFSFAKESTMKCQAGKCSSGATATTKKIPQKPIKTKKQRATVKQLFNVTTTTVQERITSKKQVNYGYIVADDAAKVDVVPWYSGFVITLYANRLYGKVKKGDALAKVYAPEVYKAKQDYLNSIHYNQKSSMPAMLESAKLKLKLLGVHEKEIRAIETEDYADYYTTIYAPISGWIFEKNIQEGASFDTKKRLFEIVNLTKVWMETKLFQNELENIKNLTTFQVKVKGIHKVYEANKTLLYPMLNSKESTATLRLSIDNTDELLKPGMYAKVYATSNKTKKRLIPRTAAIRKNGTWYAFLATEFQGEYEPIEITVQPLDNIYFEVLSGLRKGDTIVTNALFMMDSDAQLNALY